MTRIVKIGLTLAGMALVGVGCGGTSPIASSSPSSIPNPPLESPFVPEVVSVSPDKTDPVASTPSTTRRPAPAPRPAPPAPRPADPPPDPAPSGPAPAPTAPRLTPSIDSGSARACDDSLERVDFLGALGTDCETALQVAAAYDAEVMGAGTFPGGSPLAVAGGWSCGSNVSDDSNETFSVLCDRGNPRSEAVSFTWGV